MKKETKKTIVEFKDVVRTYGEREKHCNMRSIM